MKVLYTIAMMLVGIVMADQNAYSQAMIPRLRVANFMENAPAEKLDFYVDDEATPFASGLRFADASASVPISVGSHRVIAVASGAPKSEAIFTEEVMVTSDSAFTLYAVRTPGDTIKGIIGSYANINKVNGNRRVRVGFMHLSPTLGTVSCRSLSANGNPLFVVPDWTFGKKGLAGGTPSSLVTEGLLRSTLSGDKISNANIFTDQFIGEQVVTFIITGSPATNNLAIYTLHDSDTGEQRPIHKQRYAYQGDGGMRYVDCVPDEFTGDAAGRRFISTLIAYWNRETAQFLGATTVVDDLLGPTITQTYVGLDGPPEQFQLLYDTVNVRTDTLYTLFLVGTGMDSNVSTVILPTNWNNRPAPGKVRFRLFHTIPDVGSVDLSMKFSDGEERMVQGVGFKGHSEYIEVSGGPVTVRCLQAGGGKVLFESRGILPYDSTYTLLLTGMEKRKTLGSTLLNDSYSGLQRPMVQFSTVATGAEAEAKGVRGVGIWPNPSRDEFVVEYVSSGRGEDRIEVVDLFGRVVLRREVGAGIVGERLVGVRTEGLSSGSYRVRVIDGAGMEVGSGGVMVVK
ncbi:DUF4397 domain-containing protein [Nitrosomonas europaea]|uniref:DUF4397 domain-containing protein n=1 Tax=Nitrosomonas europaea TaxID=915 RepID=UPI000A65583B|nr:DUF4397 domain-containing protein [Nitrosomonas europaea]